MKVFLQACIILVVLLGISCLPSAAAQKNISLCEIHYPSDYLYEWDCLKIKAKDTPYKIFGKFWRDGLRFNRLDRRHFLAGMSIKVPRRVEDIEGFNPMSPYYQEAENKPQFILVDQNEMFLGAYEFGNLVLSAPVAVGVEEHRLRNGTYRIDAVDPVHKSSLYPIRGTKQPYPMHYGLRFHVGKMGDGWTSYWIHGRDLPGYPASHGCIGLYDEEMQQRYYGDPSTPLLMDAKMLYQWVVGYRDTGAFQSFRNGPIVLIMGEPQTILFEPQQPDLPDLPDPPDPADPADPAAVPELVP